MNMKLELQFIGSCPYIRNEDLVYISQVCMYVYIYDNYVLCISQVYCISHLLCVSRKLSMKLWRECRY